MHSRRPRRLRHFGQQAALLLAAIPLPAFAADLALSAWGTYLFFAIVATVVIVLLLHEALEDEPKDDRRRDERVGKGRSAQSRRAHEEPGNAASRRVV